MIDGKCLEQSIGVRLSERNPRPSRSRWFGDPSSTKRDWELEEENLYPIVVLGRTSDPLRLSSHVPKHEVVHRRYVCRHVCTLQFSCLRGLCFGTVESGVKSTPLTQDTTVSRGSLTRVGFHHWVSPVCSVYVRICLRVSVSMCVYVYEYIYGVRTSGCVYMCAHKYIRECVHCVDVCIVCIRKRPCVRVSTCKGVYVWVQVCKYTCVHTCTYECIHV